MPQPVGGSKAARRKQAILKLIIDKDTGIGEHSQMADHPRFGPAGMPPAFKLLKQPVTEVPKYLRSEGLDSFEYEMVRWGPKPQIKRETAETLGKKAAEHDVWLTAHGSYFINLTH